ncbi:hypothetical protein [Solibacillus sp. FSL H8-0538]|uniref:hypothetical protein n=1 Tax=Solibacillus sp. FSL H8-0538 TaxID=2921400 RepID=UPI0030F66872
MSNTSEIKLKMLLRENKIKQARIQLIEKLLKCHNTDLSDKEFADYRVCEKEFQTIYEKIEVEDIKCFKFPYSEETLNVTIDFLFDYYKKYEKEKILLYPETSRFPISDCNHLYLEYPIAFTMPLIECKSIIIKLMSEKNDDVIVISEKINIGFIIWEDEHSEVTIEYWGS